MSIYYDKYSNNMSNLNDIIITIIKSFYGPNLFYFDFQFFAKSGFNDFFQCRQFKIRSVILNPGDVVPGSSTHQGKFLLRQTGFNTCLTD